MNLLAWAVGACLMTFGTGFLAATYGARIGLAGTPNGRSSHAEVTPIAGGLGIVVGGVAAATTAGWPAAACVPMAAIGALGLADDRWHVDAALRLLVECECAASSALWLLGQLAVHPVMPTVVISMCVLVLVGTTNIYNFMDGVNGMAGLMGVVVFGTLAMIALMFARDTRVYEIAVIIAARRAADSFR